MKVFNRKLEKFYAPLAIASVASLALGILCIYSSLFRAYDVVGKNLSAAETDHILRQSQLGVNIGIGLVILGPVLAALLAVMLSGKAKPKLPKA